MLFETCLRPYTFLKTILLFQSNVKIDIMASTSNNNNLKLFSENRPQKTMDKGGTQFTMNDRQKALLRRKSTLELLNNDVALIKLGDNDKSDLLQKHKSRIQKRYPRDKRLVISVKSSKNSVFDEKFSLLEKVIK